MSGHVESVLISIYIIEVVTANTLTMKIFRYVTEAPYYCVGLGLGLNRIEL